MKRNKRQWLKVKKAAAERDGYQCIICHARATDVHHIIYRSQLGKDELANVVCLCRNCHEQAHGVNAKLWRERFLEYVKTEDGASNG